MTNREWLLSGTRFLWGSDENILKLDYGRDFPSRSDSMFSIQGGMGSIPGQGTKILHAVGFSQTEGKKDKKHSVKKYKIKLDYGDSCTALWIY